jgi:hypothetical protein
LHPTRHSYSSCGEAGAAERLKKQAEILDDMGTVMVQNQTAKDLVNLLICQGQLNGEMKAAVESSVIGRTTTSP